MSKEYIHFLYYDDLNEVRQALPLVKVAFDNVERRSGGDSGYLYAISFTTTSEFSGQQAHQLILQVDPDDYDLNNEQGDDEGEGFPPQVYTEQWRGQALDETESEITVE